MNELVYSTIAKQTNEIIRICPVSSSLTFMEDEAKKVIIFHKNYFYLLELIQLSELHVNMNENILD